MILYNADGTPFLNINVSDKSYRFRELMGEDALHLSFETTEYIEMPLNVYCEFQGRRYILLQSSGVTVQHRRNYEYEVTFESNGRLKRYKIHNMVDGRLQFDLTAKPHEHLEQVINNLNERDGEGVWSIGDCIEGTEALVSYSHTSCDEALSLIAEAFETEYEVEGNVISLHKVEYFKDNPLTLSYGKGNGFKSGVKRTNEGDSLPISTLFVQGGEQNIDSSAYPYDDADRHSSYLLLPRFTRYYFDGEHFKGETGYDETKAKEFLTDKNGYSVSVVDGKATRNEDSMDCTDVYPKRVGIVSAVRYVYNGKSYTYKELNALSSFEWEKVQIDIADDSIPDNLDYWADDIRIDGETETIVFQTGMLAGKEFEVQRFYKKSVSGKLANRFEIVRTQIDGVNMPNGLFRVYGTEERESGGDTYAVFGCNLPQAYIEDAEKEMLRESLKYLYENLSQKFTFTGTLDGIWSKRDWVNIGGRLAIGAYVNFFDESIANTDGEGVLVRITSVKDYINNPYSPEIELSTTTASTGLSTELKKLEGQNAHAEELHKSGIQFTKRNFRQAQETITMLENAVTGFTDGINPISVQTMGMLVGGENLQFQFVKGFEDIAQVATYPVAYNEAERQLVISECYLMHQTLGISDISASSTRTYQDYYIWRLPEYVSAVLADDLAATPYYLYAKVTAFDKTTTMQSDRIGEFLLSTTAHEMEEEDGYYWLLVGVLSSESDGSRSFARLHGYTEVLPGQIVTDILRSADNNLVIDLANGTITGPVTFKAGTKGLANVEEWADAQDQINSVEKKTNDLTDYVDNTLPTEIKDINNRIDGVVENWFYKYSPTLENEPASLWTTDTLKSRHIGDTFTNTEEYVDNATTPDAGKSWRFVIESGEYKWTQIADSDAVKALQQAAQAQDTADSKRRVFTATPTTPYDEGDLWSQGSGGDLMRCKNARLTGNYDASDWEKATKYTDDLAAQAAQESADKAAQKANEASQMADDAKTAADEAKTSALEAITKLGLMNSDQVISPAEKIPLKALLKDIEAEYGEIIGSADTYGVDSSVYVDAYNLAVDALTKYTDETTDFIDIEDDFENIFAYYPERTNILTAISEAAKKVADDAQSTADKAQTDASNAWAVANNANTIASKAGQEATEAKAQVSQMRYLVDTFNDGSTTIGGGVVMTNFVGVSEKNSSTIVAGLNGSADIGYNDTHGKLMFFGGSEGVTDSQLNAANTRIYEDGTIITKGGEFDNIKIDRSYNPFKSIISASAISNDNVHSSYLTGHTQVSLDWTTASSGRRMCIAGSFSIEAPIVDESQKYFYECGLSLTELSSSYEVVELLGWGTSDIFYGWIVVNRTIWRSRYVHGKGLNPLAIGRMTSTGSIGYDAASGSKTSFTCDGSTMSAARTAQGKYTLTIATAKRWFAFASQCVVLATCNFTGSNATNSIGLKCYVSVTNVEVSDTSVVIYFETADDSSNNDADFTFMIYNTGSWDD